jgi:signal transduction histidine kinase/DNA-binding NarL/FixJ family response regulator
LLKIHFFQVRTIGAKLFLAVMGGAAVGLGSTASLYYQVLEHQSEIQIRETLSTEVNAIESQLTPVKQSLKNLGGMVQRLKDASVQDPAAYQGIALDFFLKRPPLVMGQSLQQVPYGVFADRKWYASYHYEDQKVSGQIGKRLPFPNASVFFADLIKEDNAPNQAYFKDTIAVRQDTWLEPYDWYNISMTTANHLLWDRQGRLQGFVSMDVNVTQLNKTIHSRVLHDTGYFVVITQQGTLVSFPPDMSKVRQRYRSVPTLAAIWPLLQKDTEGIFQSNGKYWAYKRIPSTGWIMMAVVPESVVFWPVLSTTLGGTAIAAIVLAMVVICFVQFLNHRLKPVLDECYRLEAEDAQRSIRLGQPAEEQNADLKNQTFNFKQPDELQILQQVFWRVTAQLKASFDELELRVVERTAQLDEAKQSAEKAKEVAISANQAKSQFLANMSHELRTPLNAVLGFSQLLYRDSSTSPEQREKLGIINRSGEYLLTLINDVLTMSKIESGRVTLHETSFDLQAMLSSIHEMLLMKANLKNLKFEVDYPQEIPQFIQADEGKLRQVIINLLGNAIKFTQYGSVTLRVSQQPRELDTDKICPLDMMAAYLCFEVEDTGPGIASHELKDLFEAFAQTDTGRQSQEGTGLGLPISRTFVQLMGGDIRVKSTLGLGSCFAFDIQVYVLKNVSAWSPSLGHIKGLAPDQLSYRILIAEDRWENQQILVELLERVGFEVQMVSNGKEAITLWQTYLPHLILMDLQMPEMDGYEATQSIKRLAVQAKLSPPVIIAITANTFEETRLKALEMGFDDFINKPFHIATLFEKLAKHLGVGYVYEASSSAAPMKVQNEPDVNFTSIKLEDFQQLSPEWLNQVYLSASALDEDRLLKLIEQISEEHPAIASMCLNLLQKFRFDQIVNLTKPNLGS